MKPVEALVLLLCAVVGVVLAGRRFNIPYPIALVIGGVCICLIPGLPAVTLNPELVFLVFLPPLLYAAAWFTSWHQFRANLRPILLLAVGLVLFTTLTVGWALHALVPEIPLAVAFAFGAIVSPPDAVAAAAIARQMSLPKRLVTVLEGESLVNDATGLVAMRFALAASVSGTFSLGEATLNFFWLVLGGIALGLLVGVVVARVMRLMQEELLIITVTLLAPYIAYLPGERLHVSGVLAAVAAGVYGGWKGPEILSAGARLNGIAVWSLLVFLLNCTLFTLIGLDLREVLRALNKYSAGQLLGWGVAISGVVIVVRPIWVFPAAWLPRLLSRRVCERDPIPSWRILAVLGWSGMRGVVSLAAALALPLTLGKQPFPGRELLIFLTFCVIISTLVFQGLTLPWVITRLGVKAERQEEHERETRLKLSRAALARVKALAEQPRINEAALERISEIYKERVDHFGDQIAAALGWSPDHERLVATRRLWLEALSAERHELVKLHREQLLDDELLHQIEHEIDLEEARLRSWAL